MRLRSEIFMSIPLLSVCYVKYWRRNPARGTIALCPTRTGGRKGSVECGLIRKQAVADEQTDYHWTRAYTSTVGIPLEILMTNRQPRYHAIDHLRATMISIVVFGHALLPYVTLPRAFKDPQTHVGFDVIAIFLYGFAMPAFFVTAGFSTALIHRRKGLRGLARNRFLRIFVPLIAAYIVISPLTRGAYRFAKHVVYSGSLQGGIDEVMLGEYDTVLLVVGCPYSHTVEDGHPALDVVGDAAFAAIIAWRSSRDVAWLSRYAEVTTSNVPITPRSSTRSQMYSM